MKKPAVVGQRVLLCRPTIQDLEELTALNRASRCFHRGLVSPPKQPSEFRALLKTSRRANCSCFIIHRVEDQAIVGSVNLSQIFRGGFQSAYLGYYIGERFSGQGYMSEAIQLILRHAFEELRLHRIEANVQPENTASLKLVKRAGFVKEGYSRRYLKVCGRWRDHERWAILAEDWRSRTNLQTFPRRPVEKTVDNSQTSEPTF